MMHITLPHQWLSIMEATATWSAKVEKFRVTLNEITLTEEAELVRIPQERNAKDVVVFLDHFRKMSYDVGEILVITNQETGETTVINVTYSIDPFSTHGGSYSLQDATDNYDLNALRAIATTKEVGNRDEIEPLPIDDLEF